MTYIYPQDVIPKLSYELLLLFPGLLVHCTRGDISVCTDAKSTARLNCVGRPPACVSRLYECNILSCLCGGEGICAIMFYTTSGYS